MTTKETLELLRKEVEELRLRLIATENAQEAKEKETSSLIRKLLIFACGIILSGLTWYLVKVGGGTVL